MTTETYGPTLPPAAYTRKRVIEGVRRTEFGSIIAAIDGLEFTVPEDMGNADRFAVWDQWEMAPAEPGTPDEDRVRVRTIPPYEPPPPNPFPNLEPDQFWFVVRAAGHEAELRAWVAAMNDPGTVEGPNPTYDPLMWAAASAKLDFAKFFERDHPLVDAARVALGMSETELDDLWRYAAA